MLATYACKPSATKGRLYAESDTPYRNEFERDRDRIIHSNAFRRLQYKTQVFVNHEGDHYRNRLTHSIEVSTVARSIAKSLNLSEDLAECISLAHDLGHTPFGHAGEDALNDCIKQYHPFCHNTHSLKILTKLECRYASYDGLNLCWEVLEGIVKHNGPLVNNIHKYILEYDKINFLDLSNYSSAESQVSSLSDDIAYICHDLEDSIRAGVITINDLEEIDSINFYIKEIKNKYINISETILIYEVVRKLIHKFIHNLLSRTNYNLKNYNIETCDDIRKLNKQIVEFDDEIINEISIIKKFLFARVYKHERVIGITEKAKKVVKGLYNMYYSDNSLLPSEWQRFIISGDNENNAFIIADYIAGMTDRFAINNYEKYYQVKFEEI